MDHYFKYNEDQIENKRDIHFIIEGQEIVLESDTNTFSNKKLDGGTRILIETISKTKPSGKLLDLGCGYGPVGITLNLLYRDLKVTMSDVNPLCCKLATSNAQKYGLNIDVKTSDSFTNINTKFNLIAFNPPISCGKETIYKMYKEAQEHLDKFGELFIVIRKDKGANSHLKYLSSLFPSVCVIYKEKGYYIILAK